jgi:hypothetical protein
MTKTRHEGASHVGALFFFEGQNPRFRLIFITQSLIDTPRSANAGASGLDVSAAHQRGYLAHSENSGYLFTCERAARNKELRDAFETTCGREHALGLPTGAPSALSIQTT